MTHKKPCTKQLFKIQIDIMYKVEDDGANTEHLGAVIRVTNLQTQEVHLTRDAIRLTETKD